MSPAVRRSCSVPDFDLAVVVWRCELDVCGADGECDVGECVALVSACHDGSLEVVCWDEGAACPLDEFHAFLGDAGLVISEALHINLHRLFPSALLRQCQMCVSAGRGKSGDL